MRLAGCKSLSGKDEPSTRSECCVCEGVTRSKTDEQHRRSVHSESDRPQGSPRSPKSGTASRTSYHADDDVFNATEVNMSRLGIGERRDGLPESTGRGMSEETRTRTWETLSAPVSSLRYAGL